VKLIAGQGIRVKGSKVAVLGITFKEDVPDLRNTKVVDIIHELKDFGIEDYRKWKAFPVLTRLLSRLCMNIIKRKVF